MPTRLQVAWRAAVHAIVPLLLVLALKGGIHVPDSWSGLLETGLYGAGMALYVAVEHWLQTRVGDDWRARWMRGLGRLMAGGVPLGLPAATPPAAV